jgi:hypothetical protein
MTETEWLSSDDPDIMLEFLRGKTEENKLRLFACACCNRISHLIQDTRSSQALLTAERFARGSATISELQVAAIDALDAASADGDNGQEADAVAASAAVEMNVVAAARAAAWAHANSAGDAAGVGQSAYEAFARSEFSTERLAQAALLRSIIGNPFRTS